MKKICLAMLLALMLAFLPSLAEMAQFEFITSSEAAQDDVEGRVDAWIDRNGLADSVTEDVRQALITIVRGVENGAESASVAIVSAWTAVLKWSQTAPDKARIAIESFISSPEVQQFLLRVTALGDQLAEELSQLNEEFRATFGDYLDIAGEAFDDLGDALGDALGSLFG